METFDPGAEGWRRRELPGFAGLVGPLWTRKEAAAWAYAILADARHANPAGIVHGGLLTTLIDHALSAIAWEASARVPCLTVHFECSYFAAVKPGDFIEARGEIDKRTGSLVFMSGELSVRGETVLGASAILKLSDKSAQRP